MRPCHSGKAARVCAFCTALLEDDDEEGDQ